VAAVVQDDEGGVLEERAERIGTATNNVAEYRALLLGIERAASLGAGEIELVGDSELIVRQVRGEYKVKDATLRGLHEEATRALADFEEWSIHHVPREENAEADRLVNQALDGA
jgi:ribonuclease HI